MASTVKPGIVNETIKTLTTSPLSSIPKSNASDCAMKYAGAFGWLIVSAIAIYTASTDDKALTDGFFKYMAIIILPIVVGSFLILPIFKQRANTLTLAMNAVMGIVLLFSVYMFYQTKDPASVVFVKYGVYLVGVLFVVVILAILYKIAIRYIYNSRGWFSVFFQIVFFIPCLLLEWIEHVKYELGVAPNTVFILIAIEVLIVLFYIGLPKIVRWSSTGKTNVILNEPVFLNQKTQITDSKILSLGDTNETAFIEKEYRKNYSISFWAYLNTNSNVPITIFRVGNENERQGKPLVSYSNGKCQFYFTNIGNPSPFEIAIPIQKWNYVVMSYNGNKVDLFINGNLEKTVQIELPSYSEGDVIEVGQNGSQRGVLGYEYTTNTGNVSGSICNVRYHKTPMTQYQIIAEYNLLMFTNPPIQ
jgi:hypothetical protein